MTEHNKKLSDLGEFKLLSDVIQPMAMLSDPLTEAGDDCTFVEVGNSVVAITADVGPKPLIDHLPGMPRDYEAGGWLAAVASISDVATAGALPLFMTNCIDAPPNLGVEELKSFMGGYFKACKEYGFKNGGGDIRQGESLVARVFAVGALQGARRVGRAGARPHDLIVAIGPTGRMMSTYQRALCGDAEVIVDGALSDEAADILRFPRPQLKEMARLVERGFINAASDTSDGLLGAIDNMARRSGCGFAVGPHEGLLPHYVVKAAEVCFPASPWNLFFCWGDWSVAAAIPPELRGDFELFCSRNNIEHRIVGEFTASQERVAFIDGLTHSLNIVRNENFRGFGYNTGISNHIDYMLRTPLFS